MTEELLGAVVGGAIGIIAAVVGGAVTFWFAIAAEHKKERAARQSALKACRLEVASVASTLHAVGVTRLPALVATERLIGGGMLGDMEQTTARELLLFSVVAHDLNDTLRMLEMLACSLIAAGEGKVASPVMVEWRNRADRLSKTVRERAEVLVKALADELSEN